MTHWQWVLVRFARKLWVRATLIGLMGVAAAVLATVAERFVPLEMSWDIGTEAVDTVLNIIASSMLAVTTFSLSVMTSAYGSATSNVTPRANKLLMEDRATQNVLSTFIGSFLFAIVGIVALQIGAYGERGRSILFAVTLLVIALIVISLLRWIDHLTRLGRVGETTARVEEATLSAIEQRLERPYLGGRPFLQPSRKGPHGSRRIDARRIGYIAHIDMGILGDAAEEADARIFVAQIPGGFVYADTPLVWLGPDERAPQKPDERGQTREAKAARAEALEALENRIRSAFSIEAERNFTQDPRFGLVVLSEIASRALSPGVNDPGTAIDVIGRHVRLLSRWAEGVREPGENDIEHKRVHVPPLRTPDLFEDAFMLLARDGASMIEVQLRLQKALGALARIGTGPFREAALHQGELAMERAMEALAIESDRERLEREVRAIRLL